MFVDIFREMTPPADFYQRDALAQSHIESIMAVAGQELPDLDDEALEKYENAKEAERMVTQGELNRLEEPEEDSPEAIELHTPKPEDTQPGGTLGLTDECINCSATIKPENNRICPRCYFRQDATQEEQDTSITTKWTRLYKPEDKDWKDATSILIYSVPNYKYRG